jgi:hypothetical protein
MDGLGKGYTNTIEAALESLIHTVPLLHFSHITTLNGKNSQYFLIF